MTVKLVVLYTQPDDPAAFEEHYLGVHMPLVAALPGLQRAEAGRLTAPTSHPPTQPTSQP